MYHGTTVDAISSIKEQGILPDKKRGVWATSSLEIAQRYGLTAVPDYEWDVDYQQKTYTPEAQYAIAVIRVADTDLVEIDPGMWHSNNPIPPESIVSFEIYDTQDQLIKTAVKKPLKYVTNDEGQKIPYPVNWGAFSPDVYPKGQAPEDPTRTDITEVIHELVKEYGQTPYEINNGDCQHFAYELHNRVKGAEVFEVGGFWMQEEVDEPSHFFIRFNNRYYDAETPQGVKDWKNLPIFHNITGKEKLYQTHLKKLQEGKFSSATPYKKANVQIGLPATAAAKIFEVSARIPDEELGGDGREDKPHITVKFGVEENINKLYWAVGEQAPFTITLGKTHVFKPSSSSDGQAPVVAEAHAPDLGVLHELVDSAVGNRPDDFEYKPHVTLAYVKPEVADKYEGLDWVEGLSFTVDSLTLSRSTGVKTEIPFGYKKTAGEMPLEVPASGISKSSAVYQNAPQRVEIPGGFYATYEPHPAEGQQSNTWEIFAPMGKKEIPRKIGEATLLFYPAPVKYPSIDKINLQPEYLGKGIGRALMKEIAKVYGGLTSDPQGVTSNMAVSMWKAMGGEQVPTDKNSKGYMWQITAAKGINISKLEKIALEAREEIASCEAAGKCQEVSDAIVEKLQALGVDAYTVDGYYRMEPHNWVQFDNTYIDGTSDQFDWMDGEEDSPYIRIGKITDSEFKEKYRGGMRVEAACKTGSVENILQKLAKEPNANQIEKIGEHDSLVLHRPVDFYHATPTENVKRIQSQGLVPYHNPANRNEGKGISLGTKQVAEFFARMIQGATSILEIQLPTGTRIFWDDESPNSIFVTSRIPGAYVKNVEQAYSSDESKEAESKLAKGQTVGQVYLLHFDQPYKHARHYLGWAENAESRIEQHRHGTGARLTQVIKDAGITFLVAKIWDNVERGFERRLKNQGGLSRHCPICRAQGIDRDTVRKQHLQEQIVPAAPATPEAGPDYVEVAKAASKMYNGGSGQPGKFVTYWTPNKEMAESYVVMHNDRYGDDGKLSEANFQILHPAPWEQIETEAEKLGIDNDTMTPASIFDHNLHGDAVGDLVKKLSEQGYDGAILDDIGYGVQIEDKAHIVFNKVAKIAMHSPEKVRKYIQQLHGHDYEFEVVEDTPYVLKQLELTQLKNYADLAEISAAEKDRVEEYIKKRRLRFPCNCSEF